MHSAHNLTLWDLLCARATRKAAIHGLKWHKSPSDEHAVLYTVESRRDFFCIEMDDAGMVAAVLFLKHTYGYACHVSHINLETLEAIIDLMAPEKPQC